MADNLSLNAEYTVLGGKTFTAVESQGKLTFFDSSEKDGLSISGSGLDIAAIKKDISERFKTFSFTPIRGDIAQYIAQQQNKGNSLYKDTAIERLNNVARIPAVKRSRPQNHLQGQKEFDRMLETSKKAGYVQGVCECVAIVGGYDKDMCKKLLSKMNVNKDMAHKYAKPETYKALEQGIFAPPQKIVPYESPRNSMAEILARQSEQAHGIKR